MNDTQIVTIAITVLAVLTGALINNARIGDLSSLLSKRIDDSRDVLRAEQMASTAKIEAKLDAILKLLADVDSRVTRLEGRSA
jgi:hypothetical protein